MSISRSMPLLRRISYLATAAIFAAVSLSAQSASFSNESSSSSIQLVDKDGLGGAAAAANGSGGSQHASNWKQYLSENIALEAGAGFNAPIGNDAPFITWGGNLTLGGGLHFSKRLALLTEYQLIDDKLPGSLIAAYQAEGGHAHLWSFTLDPVIDLFPKRINSVYVTGGGGFYRKVTTFTDEECCDYYGYAVNVTAGHFSSNQGGVNAGFGVTHRVGGVYGDGKMQLFAEARYLFPNTPRYTPAFTTPFGTTGLIPVTFGVRW